MVLKFIGSRLRYRIVKIKIAGRSFDAYVADSFLKHMVGLMHRRSLKDTECMLFVFGSDAGHGIWMHNMMFPIDTVWVNRDRRIVHIERDMHPCKSVLHCRTYEPKSPNRFVIELNSGTARRLKLNVGDRVLGF